MSLTENQIWGGFAFPRPESPSRRKMAKPWFGFPITQVRGNFGGAIYRMTKGKPTMSAASHYTPTKHTHKKKPRKCACQAWQKADIEWQRMSENEKANWRAAVKKPGMSGYHLWMSETVWAYNQGISTTGLPSQSGGYRYSHIKKGYVYFPPDDCVLQLLGAT